MTSIHTYNVPPGHRLQKRFWKSSLALTTVALAALAPAARATTLTVPTQYSRIQDAIDAAASGDSIEVLPGAYSGFGNTDLNLGSKNLTIESTGGAAVTTLDNSGGAENNQIQTMTVSGHQTSQTTLRGFTIKNSFHDLGGAITIEDSTITIQQCIFVGNYAPAEGGAIAVISNNAASGAIISQCSFIGNSTGDLTTNSGFGGAIECIVNNTGLNQNVSVINCVFDKNTASYDGGAIDVAGYTAASPKVSVVNCTFVKNNSSGYVAPNFVGLIPAPSGSSLPGVVSEYNGAATLTNCVLYSDSAPKEVSTLSPGFTASYSDINQAGYAGSQNNFSSVPNFDDAAESDPTLDNLREQRTSPLIETGDPVGTVIASGVTVPSVDRDNVARHGTSDVGAYEFLTPTATAQTVTTTENAPVSVVLQGVDPNTPAQSLTFSATTPAHGVLTGTAPNLTYTPSADYYGSDSFTFTVNNGVYTSASATVTINVSYDPAVQSLTSSANIGGGLPLTVTATISSPAPAGGYSLKVSSNSPAIDDGAITFAPGSSTGTVDLTTHPVNNDTPVTLSATAGGATQTDNVTVQAIFRIFGFNAPSGNGGVAAAVGIALYGPAGPGGITVSLSSTDTGMVPPGTTVTIPQGSTVAWFRVVPSAVNTDTTISATATLGTFSKSANYTVLHPALLSLTAPAYVTAGLPFKVTATLKTPAPAGGVTVAVDSNSPGVSAGSITIAAGAKSGSATFSSHPVNSTTPVTLTGTYGGASVTTDIAVQAGFQTIGFNASTINSGSKAAIGIALYGPAGPGGVTIALSSTDTGMIPPGTTVTIPQGSTSVWIRVTPTAVNTNTIVSVTGTLGSDVKFASTTIISNG
ncbi:hypothetical protein CCAX7_43120 [Capsulimonas corticalis]|uniref:Uncharacterized protein n=1 Tax=Capsulimonas corticalis TaxID=2219043 RepID=A0A402CXH5_9BACT|nr:Ig-like domain-containing protein [Capsulimonas corticalis]BDI32261.1 hypothetical protein CCAX7_43120 [Capsulimonas corticalis]